MHRIIRKLKKLTQSHKDAIKNMRLHKPLRLRAFASNTKPSGQRRRNSRRLFGLLLLPIAIGMPLNSTSQENTPPKFGITFSGFANAQIFYDTRQMAQAREGMVSLFPLPPLYDANGEDINAKASLNQLAMTSRLRGDITGPDVWGAQTSAAIEGDFTGQSNFDNNGFRLREAWAKMQWKNTSVLVGYYWHPLYAPEVRPFTIGLNTGAPFHAFSRHNQVRIEQQIKNFRVVAFAGMQRDYASDGPHGRSPVYQRNAAFPNLDLQLHYSFSEHIVGAGLDYKQIRPELSLTVNESTYKLNQKLGSLAATFFGKFKFPFLEVKFQSIWGQNLTEHIMLGGYAVQSIDPLEHEISYTNSEQISFWTDLITTGKTLKVGLFAGYAENLGLQQSAGTLFTAPAATSLISTASPRDCNWHLKNMLFAVEFEYTAAAYGTPDDKGMVQNAEEVGNLRVLLGVFIFLMAIAQSRFYCFRIRWV
ncbi:MAG: hypothetical protein U5Q03_04100 [Bacteroidota bacterium]|nr:hypothetical protein [Bacteroidota bacterium]